MGQIHRNGPRNLSPRRRLENGQKVAQFRPEGSSFSTEEERESARAVVVIDMVSKECSVWLFWQLASLATGRGAHNLLEQ